MKKLISIIAAIAMCATAVVSASAAEITATSDQSTNTNYTFDYTTKYDPSYTITIPAEVTLKEEGTPVEIKAEDVKDLGDSKISVTIAGTNYFRNQLVLEGQVDKAAKPVMRYQLITSDGTVIETTGNDTATGKEVASFTANGSETLTVKPVIAPSTQKDLVYTGTMTYAVAVVDAK